MSERVGEGEREGELWTNCPFWRNEGHDTQCTIVTIQV